MGQHKFNLKKLQEACIRKVINELHEINDEENSDNMTPFDNYTQDYPLDDFNVDGMTKDDLANWCLNVGDFLYIFNVFGKWRISSANSQEVQDEIANDIINCDSIEKTHKMDWLIENNFDRMFGSDHVAVFLLHGTKDGDYYIIYSV